MKNNKKITLIITIILFIIISIRFIYLRIYKYNYYLDKYNSYNTKYVYKEGIRGKILDTNGNILVDSISTPQINYRKLNNISKTDEISLAYELIYILDFTEEASIEELQNFYLLTNDTNYLLTDEEKELSKIKELKEDEIISLKKERLTNEINKYNLKDRIAIHLYFLMNKDYYYDTKNILPTTTQEICARVVEKSIPGLTCDTTYVRVNKYNTLYSIFGSIGNITSETKEYYNKLSYQDNFKVGISGLEEYYETLLHATPSIYQVNQDNTLTLIKESTPGENLVLSLDINIQQKVEEIIKNNLLKSKSLKNTKYFNTSYAIISKPDTGELLAASGLSILNDNNNYFYKDVTSNIILSSFTVGSVVKGASHTVGYLNNAISINKYITDSCVKLYNVPEKCSYKRLGSINDITALKTSSNYFQFITAIKTTGNTYKSNMKLDVTADDFQRYRSVFKTYGLGSLTNIDYKGEVEGITGLKIAPDLLLNLAIGEYDTYTPIQLLSYINTIANNGIRTSLSFKKQINNQIDNVNLEETLMSRIQKGFYEVVNGGTGRGYTNTIYKPVGKTGTAEAYYDSKTITINQSYIGYAPVDQPKYSLVVMSPNISYNNDQDKYIAPINRYISRQISDFLFANY